MMALSNNSHFPGLNIASLLENSFLWIPQIDHVIDGSNTKIKLHSFGFEEISLAVKSKANRSQKDWDELSELIQTSKEVHEKTHKFVTLWAEKKSRTSNSITLEIEMNKGFRQSLHKVSSLVSFNVEGVVESDKKVIHQRDKRDKTGKTFIYRWNSEYSSVKLALSGTRSFFESTAELSRVREVQTPGVWKALVKGKDRRLRISWKITLQWESDRLQAIYRNPESILNQLYEDKEGTKDLAIEDGLGDEVLKCHKCVFTVQSPNLAAMIIPKTPKTGAAFERVRFLTLSKADIGGLIGYLYGKKLALVDLSCDVAFELFKAAHTYELSDLEKGLKKLFLGKEVDWFNADCLLYLYHYSKSSDHLKDLQEHSLQLMTRVLEDVKRCEEYKRLSKEEALELTWLIINSLESKGKANTIRILFEFEKDLLYPAPVQFNSEQILTKLYSSDERSKDFTVIVGCGTEIKCHQSILAANSPVLAAMTSPETGMRESETGRVELNEFSVKGFKALLRFFYGMRLPINEFSCEIALELFQAAHKYSIPKVERALEKLMLEEASDSGWFTADTLLELYYFSRNLEQFKELEEHSLELMTGVLQNVKQCNRYKQLEKDDALELTWLLLQSQNHQNHEMKHILRLYNLSIS